MFPYRNELLGNDGHDYAPVSKKEKRKVTKHSASKKGHKHIHNLSKGQTNHNKFGGK